MITDTNADADVANMGADTYAITANMRTDTSAGVANMGADTNANALSAGCTSTQQGQCKNRSD